MSDRANQELQNSLRRPKVIATDAYLNDPIQFSTDARFDPESALKDADSAVLLLNRDTADFITVDLNDASTKFYSVHMFRVDVGRIDYEKVISKKRKIIQLLSENA